MLFYFNTRCPRCDARSKVGLDNPKNPKVKCGGCLVDDTEIVDLICTPVEEVSND